MTVGPRSRGSSDHPAVAAPGQEKPQPLQVNHIHPKPDPEATTGLGLRYHERMKKGPSHSPRPQAEARRRLQARQPQAAAAALKPSQLLALQAFEVAVRAGSFKLAAQALNLSASAVSHRIRNLEQAVGFTLFCRTH